MVVSVCAVVYVSVEIASEVLSSVGALEDWPQEVRGMHTTKDNAKARNFKEKLLF